MNINKQIHNTKWDIFPLDRILPLETVYRIFKQEYEKKEQKSQFSDNHKYLRLREAYFALFVAVVEKKVKGEEYFMLLPSNANDVDIIQMPKKGKNKKWIYDVKEYTERENSFEEFTIKTIKKRIGQYFFIIGVHKKISSTEILLLQELLKNGNSMAWLVVSASDVEVDYNKNRVIYLGNNGDTKMYDINLKNEIIYDENNPLIVYQNMTRDVEK